MSIQSAKNNLDEPDGLIEIGKALDKACEAWDKAYEALNVACKAWDVACKAYKKYLSQKRLNG